MLRAISVFFGFALPHSVTGRHFFGQLKVKRKLILTCSHRFSRALRHLHVIALSSAWIIVFFATVATGQSNNFQLILVLRHLRQRKITKTAKL